MATTKFLDPGGDATFLLQDTTAGGFYGDASSSGVTGGSVVTDIVHGGHVKSYKFGTSAGGRIDAMAFAVAQDTGTRVSWWVYFVAFPGSGDSGIFVAGNTTLNNRMVDLRITSGGVLKLYDGSSGSQIGSNGSTLSTGTWYRICVAYTVTSASVNRYEVFVNGASSISVTNAANMGTGASRIWFGNTGGNNTMDMRVSDIYIDNSSALTDTGNIWVTAKRPNANGTAVEFTTQIGAGGSGYGSGHSPQVNERPLSTTNGWSISTTTKKTEEYTIEGQSVGDINISGSTIVDFGGWIYAQVNSTANSPVHHIIVAGVATAKTMATAAGMFTAFAGSTTYPAGNTDIGMDAQYTTTPHLTSLFECGIMVAYIPAATNTGNMFLLF